MAMLLWVDEAADQAIDLGDPFVVYKAFAAMARVAKEDWPELFSVPGFAEQQVEADWLTKVRGQARTFLARYGARLDEHAHWILEQVAKD